MHTVKLISTANYLINKVNNVWSVRLVQRDMYMEVRFTLIACVWRGLGDEGTPQWGHVFKTDRKTPVEQPIAHLPTTDTHTEIMDWDNHQCKHNTNQHPDTTFTSPPLNLPQPKQHSELEVSSHVEIGTAFPQLIRSCGRYIRALVCHCASSDTCQQQSTKGLRSLVVENREN